MNRRKFLFDSFGAVAVASPLLAKASTQPCPPPLVKSPTQQASANCGVTGVGLTAVASSLAAGQNAPLGDTGWAFDPAYGIKWMNRFFYDDARKKAVLISKAEGGDEYWCNVYDDASNTWSYASWSLGQGAELGHLYESCGYDAAAGEFYDGMWNSATLKSLSPYSSKSTWTRPRTAAYAGGNFSQDIQTALAWHPNLFGSGDGGVLVMHGPNQTAGKVVAWRKQSNTWSAVGGVSWSSGGDSVTAYNGAIVYVPGADACYIATNSSTNRLFRLGAGSGGSVATATEIGTTPILCGYAGYDGNIRGILLPDPAGGPSPYILEKGGTNRVWKLSSNSWVQKSYTHPFPNGGMSNLETWCVASCQPLGVFMAKSNSPTTPSRVWRPND